MEWLDKGVYHYEAQHPPLSRIAAAIGPYLLGERSHGFKDPVDEGNAILNDSGHYMRTLTAARLGELPFVLLACAGVAVWAWRFFGQLAALCSVFFFTMLQPVIAHGGLATTDIAITAACTWAFYALLRFLENPTVRTSSFLGLTVGFACISKFSAFPFLGLGFLAITAAYLYGTRGSELFQKHWWRPLPLLVPAILVAFVVIWLCFRLTFTPLFPADELVQRVADFPNIMTRPGLVHSIVTKVYVPAPQLFRGIGQVLRHNKTGHWSYLAGEVSDHGWWYFFPVVLGIKTPLGFLLLAIPGAIALLLRIRQREWTPAAPAIAALCILITCLASRIDVGVRHVLPIFPLLSIAAGTFAAGGLRAASRFRPVLIAACTIWLCLASLLAHPDYLASFNEIASRHPAYYRLDSDLDWGQDLGRLAIRLRELQVNALSFSFFGTNDLSRSNLPAFQDIPCVGPLTGYVAISVGLLYGQPVWSKCHERIESLRRTPPLEVVGKSIFLYRFPEPKDR